MYLAGAGGTSSSRVASGNARRTVVWTIAASCRKINISVSPKLSRNWTEIEVFGMFYSAIRFWDSLGASPHCENKPVGPNGHNSKSRLRWPPPFWVLYTVYVFCRRMPHPTTTTADADDLGLEPTYYVRKRTPDSPRTYRSYRIHCHSYSFSRRNGLLQYNSLPSTRINYSNCKNHRTVSTNSST